MKPEVAQKILAQTKNNYNQIAKDWGQTRQYLWPGSDQFLKYINDGDKVLDVGCGNGRLVKLFNNVNVDYTGIDNSAELIDLAKSDFPNRNFLVGDILQLPFADNSFDLVFCISVLHHLPGKDIRKKSIVEMKRVLKFGGHLILLNWHYRSPKMIGRLIKFSLAKIIGKTKLDFGDIYLGWGDFKVKRYIHLFTKLGTKKLLESLGFKVIESYASPKTKREFCNIVTIAKKC